MSYTHERIERAFSRIHGYSRSEAFRCRCGGKVRLVGVGLSGSQYACSGCAFLDSNQERGGTDG